MSDDSIRMKLEAFTPTGNEENDSQALHQLMEEWKELPQGARQELIPSIFGIFQRNPGEAGLGTPGPLVHALEAQGGYETALKASLALMPSFYGVWMVNRILNAKRGDAERVELLGILQRVCQLSQTPEFVRTQAQRFLKRQG